MLLIEIVLTIVAWRKGWGSRALLPLGIAAAIAFLAGLTVGLTDGTEATLRTVALIVDLSALAALAIMVMRTPRPAEGQAPPHTEVVPTIVESDGSPSVRPEYFPTRPPAAAASRSADPYAV